jgi:hypothetical protein
MAKTIQNREKGVALMIAMILLLLITALAFGVIVMSNTENSINTNFKAAETEYFAARAGVEEGRNRLLPNMTDQNGTPITLVAPFLPSAPPDQGGTILYILNGVTLAQVMTPSTTASPNPYFDDQLCHDIPGGAGGIVSTPANVRCTTMVAPAIVTSTPSVTPVALDYKWVRIMIKENGSIPSYLATNGASANYPVCWDKSANPPAEAATPLVTNCQQGGSMQLARPVYLVTSLAVSPSGKTRRMIQEEVSLGITYNPNYAVFGVSKACPAIQFTGNGHTASFTAVAGNTTNPPPSANTTTGADVGSNGGISMAGNSTIAGNADVASNPPCFTPDKLNSPATATSIAPETFPVTAAPNPPPPTTSTNYTKDTTLTPGNNYGNISGSGSAVITLQVPAGQGTITNPAIFVMNSLSLSGQSTLTIAPQNAAACAGTVACYVQVIIAGNGQSTPLSLTGGSLSNPSGIPETMVFNLAQPTGCTASPCGTVQVTGINQTYVEINAPMDNVNVSGNGDIFGSLISYQTTDVGNGTIYHDNNAAPQYNADPYLTLIAFRELSY